MLQRFLKVVGNTRKLWKTEEQENIITPLNETVVFELKYKDLLIGWLKLEKGVWSFAYSDAFKLQSEILPLSDFPSLDKEYSSEELYPFFVHRIPSMKQPKVQKVIRAKKIDSTNEVALLKLFGVRSISNPFLLHAVS